MDQELQDKLYKKYPKIFKQKDLDMTETCMCWGICTGNGWYSLIDTLCSGIQFRIDNPPYQMVNCLSNKIKALVIQPVAIKTNQFLYALARLIAKEKKLTGCTSYTQESWKKRIESRPKISNWLEEISQKIPLPNYRNQKSEIPQVEALQVKEKFGGLRFYYSGGDELISGMVQMAEYLSYRTCEDCGRCDDTVGKTSGWISVVCRQCHESKERYLGKEWKSLSEIEKEREVLDKG